MITILYFARLRESLGRSSEQLDLPAGVRDIAALRQWLAQRGGAWTDELGAGKNVRAAVNQTMARGDEPLRSGDEVAFFPPVTGG
ncbi:MAG: molybdopterin converting factor subunit 1 [Rhodospirillaceae bacterium]